ncbi:MAG: UDP-N-acetylmuramate dehydrogenase [Bacteroidetes bacterium]|nr:UDP-N-acetylmuramate dehydrogenase [Bacteroidota bacterium]
MIITQNKCLLEYNTFRLNVFSSEFAEYETVDELREVLRSSHSKKWYLLSGGSNTLFSSDYDGLILHPISKNISVEREDSAFAWVRADAGVNWDNFVDFTINNNFYGSENLSIIPGLVGASPVQNIGAYGVEAKDIIDSVEVYVLDTDEVVTMSAEECHFGYRDSIFKHELSGQVIVLNVLYRLSKSFKPILKYGNLSSELGEEGSFSAKELRDKIIEIRNSKLPDYTKIGNGGSFFKNPIVSVEIAEKLKETYPDITTYADGKGVKIPAGWLIDKAGWKGYRDGDAGVYEHQALVLVNHGEAKPKDIIMLANSIIGDVKEKFGILISPEINIL